MERPKLTRRRFITQSGAAAAGALLAACSPKPTAVPPQPTAASQQQQQTATTVPTTVPSSPEPVAEATTIRHWHIWGGPPASTWLEAALKEFEDANPLIKVETTYVGGSGYDEKVNTAIAGGEPPDVLDTTGSPKYGVRKMLIDLSPLLDASSVITKEEFAPYQIIRTSWGDKLFAIPRDSDCNALFWWNKGIFEEVDLDPEKPPQTWDDLLVAAQKTTKSDASGKPVRIGFMPTYSQAWFYVWLWLTGAELFEPNPPTPDIKPTVTFNEERGVKALDIMVQLSDIVGGAPVMSSFETGFQAGAQQPFYSGQLAMMVSGDWEIGALKEYAPDLKFGVTGMPLPPDGRLVTSAGGYGCSIPVGGKMEPGWTYIEWMTCAKTSLSRCKATSKLPGNLKIADDPYFTEDPSLKVAVEILSNHGHGFPETPWGRLMWNRINRDMRDEAIFHRKPVDKAAADAAADLVNYIDMYYAYGTTGM